MELNKEQTAAIETIKEWGAGKGSALLSLTGPAGVGKTTILREVKKYINGAAWTAMTGRAALRLSEAAGVKASTLHAVLYKRPETLKNGEIEFKTLSAPSFKFLIIDESSMITPKIYNDLKQWVYFYKTRILFVGDSFQLPPILTEDERKNNGEFTIFSHVQGPELIKVMRSGDGIIDIATIIREEKRIPTKPNNAYSVIQKPDPIEHAIAEYLADPDDHMVITWRNKMRMDANHRIRHKLGHTSYLPDEEEPIIFCRNGQGVLNGQMAIVKKIVPGPIIEGIITYRILLDDKRYILCSVTGVEEFMDGQMPFIKNWKAFLKAKRKYNLEDPIPITYGYVSTAHKAQGNEFRRVTVVLDGADINNIHFRAPTTLPDGKKVPFGIRWYYTSATRSKEKLILVVGV
jgi:ATP-dependent exoDNAse (exonuclease V) alpha subunit